MLQTVETLKCSCIRLIEEMNDYGPSFKIKIDKRRISVNDIGDHDVFVNVKDD